MVEFQPIGVVHTPIKKKTDAPIQPAFSSLSGQVEIFPEYSDGLMEIEGFSHIWILYLFHESQGYELHAMPYLGEKERGIFACRAPRRPNPIGMSLLKLDSREGNVLNVRNVDMLDGTPLLDIKPHVREFDHAQDPDIGWLEGRVQNGKDAKGW